MKRNMNFTLHILSFSSGWILAQGDALTLWDLWAKLVKHLEFCVSLLHMSPDSFKSQLRTEVIHVRSQEVTEHFGFMVISTWCKKKLWKWRRCQVPGRYHSFFEKDFSKKEFVRFGFCESPQNPFSTWPWISAITLCGWRCGALRCELAPLLLCCRHAPAIREPLAATVN